jgi:ferrochelatase
MKLAIVLFNLGGPDSLEAVEPFLRNLFADPAIIRLPAFLRYPLAWLIAARRAPITRGMYERIGGSSPLLKETEAQARALEAALAKDDMETRCFIAMRHWQPFTGETARAVKAWGADRIVLLPLYPQYSTTTTASALDAWQKAAKKAGLRTPETRVCCYPWDTGFVGAEAELVAEALKRRKPGLNYRVLFSAHGLPKRIVDQGDPYQWQVEKTVGAILRRLNHNDLDWGICYQSRVGPLEWVGPATDEEIRRAGAQGKGVIVAPVAFVSEHSETLVELDLDYGKHLAREAGVTDYIRVSTVRTHPLFIQGLADLVMAATASRATVTCAEARICPANMLCGYKAA